MFLKGCCYLDGGKGTASRRGAPTLVHELGGLLVGAAHVVGLHVLNGEGLVVHHAVHVLHAADVREHLQATCAAQAPVSP